MKNQRPKYAEVAPIVPLPAHSRQAYTYAYPAHEPISPLYSRVTISLGPKHLTGVIVSQHSHRLSYPTKSLAPLSSVTLTEKQIQFANWISHTMLGGLGYTLRLFFPPALKKQLPLPPAKHHKPVTLPRSGRIANWPPQSSQPSSMMIADPLQRLRHLAWIAAHIARDDQQCLILFPEKWQLDRAAAIFQPLFTDQLLIWRANTSSRQSSQDWHRVQSNEIKIILGTQKSLFLPFNHLGLIILEDEANSVHKLWDAYPRLDNRLAVLELARIHQASVLYSGAYPSLNLSWQITSKLVTPILDHPLQLNPSIYPLTFTDRAAKRLLPLEFTHILSAWLRQHERIFILHNRKGSWSTIICRHCRSSLKCPVCGVVLSVHGSSRHSRLSCHQCGYANPLPTKCPTCHQGPLRVFGVANERAAQFLQTELKNTKITVLDQTSLRPENIKQSLSGWKRRHLFIGTTAAFSILAELGIDRSVLLMPEQSLLYPDFRSDERVLRQIIRLREFSRSKDVLIVTRFNRLVRDKLDLPLAQIYQNILTERRRLHYPPFNSVIKLTWQASTLAKAQTKTIAAREKISNSPSLIIRGPFQSSSQRSRNVAESHLLLLGQLNELVQLYPSLKPDIVDINPERII